MQTNSQNYFLPNLCKNNTIGLLILVAEIIAIVVLLLKPWNEITLEHFGWLSLFIQWVTLLCAGSLCAIRPLLMKLPNFLAATICYLLIVVVVVCTSLAYSWLQHGLIDWTMIIKNGAVSALIGAILIRYLYVQNELTLRSQAELEARIEALQSRIRPHFLFNSMNTIASLIMIDPHKAERAVEDLASLFRATLGKDKSQVTINEEVALCKKYLAMEGLRLGDRLTVEWDLAKLPDSIPIPLLTLQPIVENAIYHGIQPSAQAGWIKITAHTTNDGHVCIQVSNSVPSASPSHHKGQKMALENIRARLKAIYGESATVEGRYLDDCYVSTIIYAFNNSPNS